MGGATAIPPNAAEVVTGGIAAKVAVIVGDLTLWLGLLLGFELQAAAVASASMAAKIIKILFNGHLLVG